MLPFSEIPQETLTGIRGVFTDIDDTLTTDGYLTAEAYCAMEFLREQGISVVPITGRPAGWCDHIARMWPVSGVVGENGAFYFCYDREERHMARYYADSEKSRLDKIQRLKALGQRIIQEVPGSAISADQSYRETDIAFDICEDISPLSSKSVDKIVEILIEEGVTVKVSSIHVNGWFGNYDKMTMTKTFASNCLRVDLDESEQNFLFTGDSPNDAPMFDFFSNSIGVANVRGFESLLDKPPTYITTGIGGSGFSEVARHLIDAKLLES